MVQNGSNVSVFPHYKGQFNGGAVINEDGVEVAISEGAVQQALRELESVWMKHHDHYARVLEHLMHRVEAARGIA